MILQDKNLSHARYARDRKVHRENFNLFAQN